MNLKRTLFKVTFGLILTCLVFVAVFLFWIHSWGHYSPFGFNISKDQELIAIFHAHRTAFEKLQQMATEDAQHGWYFNSPDFEGAKLTKSRSQEYKDLVSSIKAGLTVYTDYDSSMRFIFADGGTFAIGPGWVKGIEYVPESYGSNGVIYGICEIKGTNYQDGQGVVLTNLDNAQTLPANVYLQPIESNWFIFYQRDDD
jgi:hypothetical protein